MGPSTTLAPGASVRIPVHDLVSGGRCTPVAHYPRTPRLCWLDVDVMAHVVTGAARPPIDMGQPVSLRVSDIPIVVAR